MYLKSIEVHGFKSFANKVTFEFHDGITGIVGPNGSGKSNVADAVRWVLGEQSAKQLRGSNMQDVIFSGTEMRKPLGYAYVAITLDNSDHKLPIEYPEITVTRRVYRSGESEYLLNGSQCRLKDIQELFFDTGIGKEGYSIIGQGQIDKILSGKPEERRELFDEAAGIVKFKKRKSIAEKNLEEERFNLSRITDITSELEKQIGPLQRQSEVAKEYLKQKEELKRIEVNQFLHDNEKYTKSKEILEQKMLIASNDLENTKKNFEQSKNQYEIIEMKLDKLNLDLEQTVTKRNELKLFIEKAEGEVKVLDEQIASVKQKEVQYQSRKSAIKAAIDSKATELNGYKENLTDMDQKIVSIGGRKASTNQGQAAIRDEIARLTAKVEEQNSEIIRVLNENGTVKTNIQRYETIFEQNNIKRAELNKQILENKSIESSLCIKIKEGKNTCKEVEQKVSLLKEENNMLEQRIVLLHDEIDSLTKEYQNTYQEYSITQSKREALRNLTERYDGYGVSIRKLMEQRVKNSKILGVVADVFQVEQKYETAIETALGGNIQNIVTEDEETAQFLIRFLKENKYGRATFLPLTSVKGNKLNQTDAINEEGVIDLACDLVSAEAKYQSIIVSLLGRTIVVKDLTHALFIAKKYNYSLRMVTLEGEQLNPGGSLSGGAYKNSSNLLGRRRELDELNRILKEKKAAYVSLDDLSKKKRDERKNLRELLELNKSNLQNLFVEQNTLMLRLKQEEEKAATLHLHYADLGKEVIQLDMQNQELQKQVEKLSKELQNNLTYSKGCELEIDVCNQMLDQERSKEIVFHEETSALLVEISNLEQNRGFISEHIKRIGKEIEGLRAEEQMLLEEAQSDQQLKKTREELITSSKRMQQELSEKLVICEEQLAVLNKEKDFMTKTHREDLVKREEFSNRRNELDKEIFRLQNQMDKLKDAMEVQFNYMWEEYEITISNAMELFEDRFHENYSFKASVTSIKNQIRGLGDVNVNAIEDYKNLSERYEFLSTQRDDLIAAERTLLDVIADLEMEMRKQFEDKFAEIKTRFNLVFQELFGGGTGTLELTEEEDILEAGIRIIAQPPGKKLQNMMQLSGGEKALTAISLLFAIQNLKPSPFCLLDEIEAALDDSNVKRYANYLHKLTKDTQFIIITHRRGTMAAADTLYGITMQEKGVSTLVSVNLIEGELDR